ncbi:MAG: hypothetical protein ACLTSZ_08410 [Lachnospiraceae bacterium]
MNKRIEFCPDGENETVGFFVVEETRIAGVSYLLVTESEDDEEADLYFKKTSQRMERLRPDTYL